VEPELSTAAAAEPVAAGLVEAGVYPTEHDGFAHGLVVLALGFPYWLMPGEARFRLLVEAPALPLVREQLARFDRESVGWPPPPPAARPARPADFVTPLLWVLVVQGVFYLQGVSGGRWEAQGALDAQGLFARGEVWRPFTALFLHADVGHLLSNLFFGIFVFSSLLATIGRRRGWLLLALGSYVGNLAAAALHYPAPYRSLGASTAIFAGLGLLTGAAVRVVLRAGQRQGARGVFAPFASGLVLLALYGAGGPEVDVVAHLTGFAAGLMLGLLATYP
jgi:membrane associated rhomboid family serine protease